MREPYQVRHGGLMRCCLHSLDCAMVAAIVAPKEGDLFRCEFCDSGMAFRSGAWEWDHQHEIVS